MIIDINTKFITLIGAPLAQSHAAQMQNYCYELNHLNYCYFYSETDSEHLFEIINGIRYMPSIVGCAITKPNKVAVMKYLDDLDPLCRKIGASNTIVKKKNGDLKGYNTDALGFLMAFRKENIQIKGKTFFCIGSGGVGRAICFSLADAGASRVFISDIDNTSCKSLAAEIDHHYPSIAKRVEHCDYATAIKSDVVINASGVGMGSSIGKSPLPLDDFFEDVLYFDACYNPKKTKFLELAEQKGCQIMNGESMSVFQGLAQIELWTGERMEKLLNDFCLP